MPDFSVVDKFSSQNNFERVKIGDGAKILEVELNEMQRIMSYKNAMLGKLLITDGFVSKSPMTVSGGTLTVPADTIVIGGIVWEILENMTLAVSNGDTVYLALSYADVNGASTLYKSGNLSGGSVLSNNIYDARMAGMETSRRVQAQVQLTKSNGTAGVQYLPVALMTSATTFTDNRSKCSVGLNLNDTTVMAPSLSLGMNNKITSNSRIEELPTITITGFNYVNMLGKDGSMEDLTKWSTSIGSNTTVTIDSTVKLFGNSSLKLLATSAGGAYTYKDITLDATHKYFISAYAYFTSWTSGTATNIGYSDYGAWTNYVQVQFDYTKLNQWQRKSNIISGKASARIAVGASIGSAAQTVYFDGLMLVDLTATYGAGKEPSVIATLEAALPYAEGYTCLQNPYIEVKHDNIVCNGSGEQGLTGWIPYAGVTMSVVNGKLAVTSTSGNAGAWQTVYVKPNTNYYISGNKGSSNANIAINVADNSVALRNGVGTFNSGNSNRVNVVLYNTLAGTELYDSISLVEGTVPLSSYPTARMERTVFETFLTSDDTIVYNNNKVSGQIWWKHLSLYGRDYDIVFGNDGVGFKELSINTSTQLSLELAKAISAGNAYITKYDGTPLKSNGDTSSVAGSGTFRSYLTNTYFGIGIADGETGFAETFNPNALESKIWMNGWKCVLVNGTSGRGMAWLSVVDNSVPKGTSYTTASGVSNTGQAVVTVADGTQLQPGTNVVILVNNTFLDIYGINSISGNNVTMSGNLVHAVPNGAIIMTCDDGASITKFAQWCANNVASGYGGYQVHYKRTAPEPATDMNCRIHGDIPKLDPGDNYIFLDSGQVIGEVATPIQYGGAFRINDNIGGYDAAMLRYPVQTWSAMYKNGVFMQPTGDYTKGWDWTGAWNGTTGNAACNASYHDANAVYTVDYRIKYPQAPQIGTFSLSYSQDLYGEVNRLQEQMETKQNHSRYLDELEELSMYEVVEFPTPPTNVSYGWVYTYGAVYVMVEVPFGVYKKDKPRVALANISINVSNGSSSYDSTKNFQFDSISISRRSVGFQYKTTDTATMNNIKANGYYIAGRIIADCREKV